MGNASRMGWRLLDAHFRHSPGTQIALAHIAREAAVTDDPHKVGVVGRACQRHVNLDPLSARATRGSVFRCRRHSSSRFRRSQPVTSSSHLLVMHERQAGTTLSSVYRPPRDTASMQSRCSGSSVAPQYAHPPQAAWSAFHCLSLRSCSTRSMRRLRRRAALALRLLLTAIRTAYAARHRAKDVRPTPRQSI